VRYAATLRAVAITSALCFGFAGCGTAFPWRDITGHKRPAREAQGVEQQCEAAAGFRKPDEKDYPEYQKDPKAYSYRLDATWARVETCMRERGWAPDLPPPATEY
jgi:hypothetical protein